MKLSNVKKKLHRFGETLLIAAILVCMGFAFISTHQLNRSIDLGNRKIILNYGNQVAARIHDFFARVDISLADLSRELVSLGNNTAETMQTHLYDYKAIWDIDAAGLMYEDGTSCLADGSAIVFGSEISLQDVLSYSQKLNISRQSIGGREMLVFAKPCKMHVDGRITGGVFAAIKLERLELLLGDYGYGSDSFLVLTQINGNNIWKRGDDQSAGITNCFEELSHNSVIQGDSILQMKTRMSVAMDGTIAYARDGQVYYMAYVPLSMNYWYLLVSTRSDSIDLTELSRQHFAVSALLVAAILVMGAVSIFYLIQRNRSISRYNKQLHVATAMASQANRAKQESKARQEFLVKVSHDIRTPLNGVIGMLTLAREEYSNQEKCREYLEKASVSARYLMGLLNDVLDMSQIESGKQRLVDETVDMKELLNDIEAILETCTVEKNLSFRLDDSTLLHRYFRGDKLRLKQILMNLCSNAVKYTHPGGWILLEIGETRETENSQVFFRVQDNGEGIAEDKLESIFNPFEQASIHRQGGVGLGLSIVRSFVELMGGHITVDSKLGKGSTFTVTLPLRPSEPPEKNPVAAEQPQVNLSGVSILLAEDNDINAMIAVSLLEKRGARVTHAKNGVEAVEEFRRCPQGTYQIVLMDIQMPEMDGLEATREIRKTNRPDAVKIPILSMTANAFHEQKEDMLQAGMNDFLYKPIDIEAVCSCIRKWITRED